MIFEFETSFNRYQVKDVIYNERPARVLYTGDGVAAMSGIAKDNKPELLFDYNQRFRELIQGRKPQSVLLLGGGTFTLPTALLKEFPGIYIDAVEQDGTLLEIAQKYFRFKPDKQINIHIGDAFKFLDKTARKYDVIVVDVYNDITIPAKFRTDAFSRNLKSHLNKKGALAINIIASLSGRGSSALRDTHHLLSRYFSTVQIFPADNSNLTPWAAQNYAIVAHNESWEAANYLKFPPVKLPPY